MCEVGRVFPKYVQRTCLMGELPLGCPRVAHTLRLYNYLLRFYLIYSLFSLTPYIYFSGSLRILFSLSLYNILYYKGLYSGCSIPILRIWIKCVPIIHINSIILGVVYSYRALYYILSHL